MELNKFLELCADGSPVSRRQVVRQLAAKDTLEVVLLVLDFKRHRAMVHQKRQEARGDERKKLDAEYASLHLSKQVLKAALGVRENLGFLYLELAVVAFALTTTGAQAHSEYLTARYVHLLAAVLAVTAGSEAHDQSEDQDRN